MLASELKETETELKEAYNWLQDWYLDCGKRTGLTPKVIESRLNLLEALELPDTIRVQVEENSEAYRIFNFEKSISSNFGPVTCARLVRVHSGPALMHFPEGMMIMTPVGDYSRAIAMSQGWRFDQSDLIYMLLGGFDRISRIVQTVRPGIHFTGPARQESLFDQTLSVDFYYSEDTLTRWNAELNADKLPELGKMTFSSTGGRLITGKLGSDYIMPEDINMAAIIRNIILLKPAFSRE